MHTCDDLMTVWLWAGAYFSVMLALERPRLGNACLLAQGRALESVTAEELGYHHEVALLMRVSGVC